MNLLIQHIIVQDQDGQSNNIVRVIISRRLRWAGHVARMKEGRSAFKNLTGKIRLRMPRHRWKDKIRKDLEEIGINAGNWVDSGEDRDYLRAFVDIICNMWMYC